MDFLLEPEALAKKLIRFDSDERKYITYVTSGQKVSYTNPEEKVRAETYVQLILTYGYSPHRVDVEVPVPARLASIRADIVVYTDAQKLSPFIVVECKKKAVTEAEFVQAIEQGVWLHQFVAGRVSVGHVGLEIAIL